MIKVIIGGDEILARPSQLYLFDLIHQTPNGFGIFEVDSEDRLLNWLRTKRINLYETALVRCREYQSPKFKTGQEAQDFLNDFEIEDDNKSEY